MRAHAHTQAHNTMLPAHRRCGHRCCMRVCACERIRHIISSLRMLLIHPAPLPPPVPHPTLPRAHSPPARTPPTSTPSWSRSPTPNGSAASPSAWTRCARRWPCGATPSSCSACTQRAWRRPSASKSGCRDLPWPGVGLLQPHTAHLVGLLVVAYLYGTPQCEMLHPQAAAIAIARHYAADSCLGTWRHVGR